MEQSVVQQPMAGSDTEPGKIFVGGLSWETSKENLQGYFEKFGEITDCVIMTDPVTKRPRGFGFVTFKDPGVVTQVMAMKPHILDKKTVDPKPATQKGGQGASGGMGNGQGSRVKKVFVGGIPNNATEEEIRQYFGQYGTITEMELKYDKATQRMRGFGFVGFDNEDVVEKLCQIHFHQIGGKTVEVKKAEPKHASQGFSQRGGHASYQPYGGNYGRGGGYGNYGGNYGSYDYSQQAQQHPQYGGYGYGQGGGGGYGQGGYDYSAYRNYSSQQPASGSEQGRGDSSYYAYGQGQQQLGSYPDTAGYGGTRNYGSSTENYGQQTSYQHYDTSTPSYSTTGYGDTQPTTGYGRGGGQQRGGAAYHYPNR